MVVRAFQQLPCLVVLLVLTYAVVWSTYCYLSELNFGLRGILLLGFFLTTVFPKKVFLCGEIFLPSVDWPPALKQQLHMFCFCSDFYSNVGQPLTFIHLLFCSVSFCPFCSCIRIVFQ